MLIYIHNYQIYSNIEHVSTFLIEKISGDRHPNQFLDGLHLSNTASSSHDACVNHLFYNIFFS